jgi:hypothetical protein
LDPRQPLTVEPHGHPLHPLTLSGHHRLCSPVLKQVERRRVVLDHRDGRWSARTVHLRMVDAAGGAVGLGLRPTVTSSEQHQGCSFNGFPRLFAPEDKAARFLQSSTPKAERGCVRGLSSPTRGTTCYRLDALGVISNQPLDLGSLVLIGLKFSTKLKCLANNGSAPAPHEALRFPFEVRYFFAVLPRRGSSPSPTSITCIEAVYDS